MSLLLLSLLLLRRAWIVAIVAIVVIRSQHSPGLFLEKTLPSPVDAWQHRRSRGQRVVVVVVAAVVLFVVVVAIGGIGGGSIVVVVVVVAVVTIDCIGVVTGGISLFCGL